MNPRENFALVVYVLFLTFIGFWFFGDRAHCAEPEPRLVASPPVHLICHRFLHYNGLEETGFDTDQNGTADFIELRRTDGTFKPFRHALFYLAVAPDGLVWVGWVDVNEDGINGNEKRYYRRPSGDR